MGGASPVPSPPLPDKINSAELAASLQRLASAPGLARPSRVRYFRAQMGTIISRAASALLAGAPATPSRRCVAVQAWLAERCASHYPQQVGYDPNAPPLARLDPGAPLPLPDALRGERWAFVSAPAALVGDQAARVRAGAAFGAVFPVSPASAVPGVVVFSSRALALAGWMNGLELGCVAPDARTGALLLETGVAQRWAYASWRRSAAADAEANAWAQAKKDAGGLHFLAVQRDDGDDVQGFWLMREFEGL